jgi:hypothetical protein
MVVVRSQAAKERGNGRVRAFGRDAASAALVHGTLAVRDVLRLQRRRARQRLERAVLRAAVGLAAAVAVGVAAGAAGVLILLGAAEGLAGALALPAWTAPLLAGAAVAAAVATLLRAARRRHAAVAAPSVRPGAADDDAGSVAERQAAQELARAAGDVVRPIATPLGLLLAAAGGFAACRALRRRPLTTSAVLGALDLGSRLLRPR